MCVCLMKAMSITSAVMCHVSARLKAFNLLTRLFCLMFLSVAHIQHNTQNSCIDITISNYFVSSCGIRRYTSLKRPYYVLVMGHGDILYSTKCTKKSSVVVKWIFTFSESHFNPNKYKTCICVKYGFILFAIRTDQSYSVS